MSHYDTLGIDKAASPDEIRAGFRKSASAAHPDKAGGSNERMAAINRAYEVLSDPERRAKYDASGDDAAPVSEDDEAKQMLIATLNAVVESSSPLRDARNILAQHAKQLQVAIDELKSKRRRLDATRKKVFVKKGENLMHTLIDGQIATIGRQLVVMDRGMRVNGLAVELLNDYEQYEEQMPTDAHLLSAYSAGGGHGFFSAFTSNRRYERSKR